jgi:hypothetical protein
MQDDNPQLSRWFATRPDALYVFIRNNQMKLNEEQQAFMKAYGQCMAVAPDHEIEYFFEHKDKTQVGTFREQQLIREGITYWGHIEDAWLLWQEARKFGKETS